MLFDDGFGDVDQDGLDNIVYLSYVMLNDEEFRRSNRNVIKRDNVQDKLLDVLIKSKDPSWEGNSGSYIQKDPYASVDVFLNETNSEIAIPQIKNYLDKIWYKGHDESHWHGMLENNNLNYYFGYWAWEVAALVKVLNIDDTELKYQKYYTYDAVHW